MSLLAHQFCRTRGVRDRFSPCDCCELTTSKFVKRSLSWNYHVLLRLSSDAKKKKKKKTRGAHPYKFISYMIYPRIGMSLAMYNKLGDSGVGFAFLSGHEIQACSPLSLSAYELFNDKYLFFFFCIILFIDYC